MQKMVAVLVAGLAACGSYHRDIQALCDSSTVQAVVPSSKQGRELAERLAVLPVRLQVAALRREANTQHVTACALADSLERAHAEALRHPRLEGDAQVPHEALVAAMRDAPNADAAALALNGYYFAHGYVNAKVEVDNDASRGEPKLVITEGEPYRMGALTVNDPVNDPVHDKLAAAVARAFLLHEGDVFDREKIVASLPALHAIYAAAGFPGTAIDPGTHLDPASHTVAVRLDVARAP